MSHVPRSAALRLFRALHDGSELLLYDKTYRVIGRPWRLGDLFGRPTLDVVNVADCNGDPMRVTFDEVFSSTQHGRPPDPS